MDRDIRIARELVRIARGLVASDWQDAAGEFCEKVWEDRSKPGRIETEEQFMDAWEDYKEANGIVTNGEDTRYMMRALCEDSCVDWVFTDKGKVDAMDLGGVEDALNTALRRVGWGVGSPVFGSWTKVVDDPDGGVAGWVIAAVPPAESAGWDAARMEAEWEKAKDAVDIDGWTQLPNGSKYYFEPDKLGPTGYAFKATVE